MSALLEPTISGFNEYVSTLKKDLKNNEVYFSAIKFDSEGVRKLQVGAALKDAVVLSNENYRPNAMTPLYDAVGKTIEATDEVVREKGADRVIVMIQTDGYENASTQFTANSVKELIEARKAKGWVFVFIGAGINAYEPARSMGIGANTTVSYGADKVSTANTFYASASNASATLSTGNLRMANFSGAQKFASGDKYDPSVQVNVNLGVPPVVVKKELSSNISDLKLTSSGSN